MKKTILISGANSCMARTFVKAFSNKYDFIGADKSAPEKANYAEFIKWDVSSDNKPIIKQKIDMLIHYAGLTDIKFCEDNKEIAFSTNVFGTFNTLEFAKNNGVKKFINISTGGVYKESDSAHKEDGFKEPPNFYAFTKFLGEKLCENYSKYFKIAIVRPFFPYGPETHPERLINRLFTQIKNDAPILLNHGGKPKINPCYIEDFNYALDSIIEKDESNCSDYNIGGAETATIKEICEIAGNILGKKPLFTNTGKDAFNILSDNSKINKIFKVGTGIREGMEKTLKSLNERLGACNERS